MFNLLIALALSTAVQSATPTATPPAPPASEPSARAARYEQLFKDTGNAAMPWLIAEAHAEAGQEAAAIAALERVAGRGLGFVVTPESALNRLAGEPQYDELGARMQREAHG